MLSWISVCKLLLQTFALVFTNNCSMTNTVRGPREGVSYGCSDWLLRLHQPFDDMFFAVWACPADGGVSLWYSLAEYFPPRLAVSGAEATAAWKDSAPLSPLHRRSQQSFGFTCKNEKMAHFNKGPAYGLSAEVRSKVSFPVLSVPLCLRGKHLSEG